MNDEALQARLVAHELVLAMLLAFRARQTPRPEGFIEAFRTGTDDMVSRFLASGDSRAHVVGARVRAEVEKLLQLTEPFLQD